MAILSITREYGSGGREVGRTICANLRYAYEDRITVLAALRSADPAWERWGSEYDEHRPSLWERFDWSFRGYAALMQVRLLESAAAGRVVIVGRGGNFLLAGVPTALRVRVVAPKAARIERIMRREHADHDSVKRLIEATDRERAGFIKAVYRRPWDAPAAYDRLYDTGLIEQETIVAEVTSLLAERDRADCREAARVLGLRLAAAGVRAALFTEPRLQLPVLEVAEDAGGIVVRGVVHTPAEKRRVEEVAAPHAAEHPLRFELRYR